MSHWFNARVDTVIAIGQTTLFSFIHHHIEYNNASAIIWMRSLYCWPKSVCLSCLRVLVFQSRVSSYHTDFMWSLLKFQHRLAPQCCRLRILIACGISTAFSSLCFRARKVPSWTDVRTGLFEDGTKSPVRGSRNPRTRPMVRFSVR